jgi:hypothetical protein
MNHCKDCKHFRSHDAHGGDRMPDWGRCALADSTSGEPDDQHSLSVATDFECFQAWLAVRPEFGCIQFEPKEQG